MTDKKFMVDILESVCNKLREQAVPFGEDSSIL